MILTYTTLVTLDSYVVLPIDRKIEVNEDSTVSELTVRYYQNISVAYIAMENASGEKEPVA